MDNNLFNTGSNTIIWSRGNEKYEVNALYRYILTDDDKLKVDKKFIKTIKRSTITFSDNSRIKVDRMYSVFGGNLLYLPYRDDREAVRQLYSYCQEKVAFHKEEINKYRRKADILMDLTEADIINK